MSAALQVSDFGISFCLVWEDRDIEEQKHISWSCLTTALAEGNTGNSLLLSQQLPPLLSCTPAEQQSRHCCSDPLNVLSKRTVPFKNDTDGEN